MSETVKGADERAVLFPELTPEVLAWAQTINFDVNRNSGEDRSPHRTWNSSRSTTSWATRAERTPLSGAGRPA